jgi:hypothetical protein
MVDFGQEARRAKDEHVWLKALAPVHNNGNVKTLRNVFDGFHTDVGYFEKVFVYILLPVFKQLHEIHGFVSLPEKSRLANHNAGHQQTRLIKNDDLTQHFIRKTTDSGMRIDLERGTIRRARGIWFRK